MTAFTDRGCADCGVENRVMVAMRPGVDGREWFLCAPCRKRSTTPEPTVTLDSVKSIRTKAPKSRERQGQH